MKLAYYCGVGFAILLYGCAGGSGGGGRGRPSANDNASQNTNAAPNENTNTANDNATNTNSGPPDLTGPPGEPRGGLSSSERAEFDAGRAMFEHRFTALEGLGPQLNATSCASCHDQGGIGGGGERFRNTWFVARSLEDGTIAPIYTTFYLPSYGPSEVFPAYAGDDHPPTPASADVVAQRNSPPLYGVGLFELIDDTVLLALQDPGDADGDGISGVANIVDGRVGRFGYKSQGSSIEAFVRGTLQEHIGITSEPLDGVAALQLEPDSRTGWRRVIDRMLEWVDFAAPAHAQIIIPGQPTSADGDEVPEPEINRSDLAALVAFVQRLAAPRRGSVIDAVTRGAAIFDEIGCSTCHVPELATSLGPIHAYSDLLLHDMGAELADGVRLGRAAGGEFRTAPLWGLCRSAPYLYDGRADTIEDAIAAHGGEAEASRGRYVDLSDEQRSDLIEFVNSL